LKSTTEDVNFLSCLVQGRWPQQILSWCFQRFSMTLDALTCAFCDDSFPSKNKQLGFEKLCLQSQWRLEWHVQVISGSSRLSQVHSFFSSIHLFFTLHWEGPRDAKLMVQMVGWKWTPKLNKSPSDNLLQFAIGFIIELKDHGFQFANCGITRGYYSTYIPWIYQQYSILYPYFIPIIPSVLWSRPWKTQVVPAPSQFQMHRQCSCRWSGNQTTHGKGGLGARSGSGLKGQR
jgi:hypothetical protein